MEYINKNSKTGNDSKQQKGCLSRPQFKKSKGHAPSSSSALASRDRISIMVRTPKIGLYIQRVVLHKGVVRLLLVPSLVGITSASVGKSSQVVSSAVRPDIS